MLLHALSKSRCKHCCHHGTGAFTLPDVGQTKNRFVEDTPEAGVVTLPNVGPKNNRFVEDTPEVGLVKLTDSHDQMVDLRSIGHTNLEPVLGDSVLPQDSLTQDDHQEGTSSTCTPPVKNHSGLSKKQLLLVTELSGVVNANPDIMRGVRMGVLLQGMGYWFRKGPVGGTTGYAFSFPVQKLQRFFSHSWHAPGKIKAAALIGFYNGQAAALAGLLTSFVLAAMTKYSLLPHWNDDAPNWCFELVSPGGPDRVSISIWCGLGSLSVYLTVLVFWQPIRQQIHKLSCRSVQDQTAFLDKLCINQSDADLRKQGILAIGSFLLNSREFVMLWDQTYFQRIWCVFEIAIFLALCPEGSVIGVPIALYTMEIVLGICGSIWFVGWGILVVFEVPHPLRVHCLILVFLCSWLCLAYAILFS